MTQQSDHCAKRNFIVTTDCMAIKVSLINHNSKPKPPNLETQKLLPQGTLLEEFITDRRERTNSLHRSRQIIAIILGSAGNNVQYYAVELNKVLNVDPEEAQLLLAVDDTRQRMQLHTNNSDLINDAKSAHVGSLVKVQITSSQYKMGVILFKDGNPMFGKGIYFGIKYLNPDKIATWSDFQLKTTDFDIITSFDRLQFLKKNIEALSFGSKIQQLSSGHTTTSQSSVKNAAIENVPLTVGEKVVWISDNGPEFGIVRWIGTLDHQNPVAGVEFENPVGSGTGAYNEEILFTTKPNHASFVPIAGLMREKDFKPTSKHKLSFSKAKKKKDKQSKATTFYDLDNSSLSYKPQHTYIKALESNSLKDRETNSQFSETKTSVFQGEDLSPRLQRSQRQQQEEPKSETQSHHEQWQTKRQEPHQQESHHIESFVENDNKPKEDVNPHHRQQHTPIHAQNDKLVISKIKPNYLDKSSKTPSLENFKNEDLSSKNSTISQSSSVSGSYSKVKNRHSVPSPLTQRRSSSSSSTQEINDLCTQPQIVNNERVAYSEPYSEKYDELKTKPHATALGVGTKPQNEKNISPSYSSVCRAKPVNPNYNLGKTNFRPESEIVLQNNKNLLPNEEISPIEDNNFPYIESEHMNYGYQFKNKHFEKEQEVNDFLLDPEQGPYLSEIHFNSLTSSNNVNAVIKPCEINIDHLEVGSVVEILIREEPCYGVIKWIGYIEGYKKRVAGLEMEKEISDVHCDGAFGKQRYFTCPPGKGFFISLEKCRRDGRFLESLQTTTKQRTRSAAFGSIDCPAISGDVAPLTYSKKLLSYFGKNKGIQGHHNSCYLDATLFSMFTFSSVFDSLLHRPPTPGDIEQYQEVQRVLKEDIVNPLRQNLYVRADRVMKLRKLLDNLSSISGLTCEEKDPEEFLHSLLHQILKAEPFLKLDSGQEAYFYQLFVEKNDKLQVPTVQQLFDQSFLTSDIKLKEIPSCLIIQMPRFGKQFKTYNRIFPSPVLDITDVLDDSPRQCSICGNIADYECRECFSGLDPEFSMKAFCENCVGRAHSHSIRAGHSPRKIKVPEEFTRLPLSTIPRNQMDLFAVVCIETSHYVAFVKCGENPESPWCFFDSMADRKGEQNGYNIPEVISCPHVSEWLSLDNLHELLADQEIQLPELAKRLFSDAYMCMYQSSSVMMYR